MDARHPAGRREIADLADALRLSGGAHWWGRGRRRDHRPADPAPTRAGPPAKPHRVGAGAHERDRRHADPGQNEYFLDHPETALGQFGAAAAHTAPTTSWSPLWGRHRGVHPQPDLVPGVLPRCGAAVTGPRGHSACGRGARVTGWLRQGRDGEAQPPLAPPGGLGLVDLQGRASGRPHQVHPAACRRLYHPGPDVPPPAQPTLTQPGTVRATSADSGR